MKKILIVILICFIAGTVWYFYESKNRSVIIGGKLSKRAEKYLAGQQAQGGGWNVLNNKNNHVTPSIGPNKTFTVDGCFSIIIPFKVSRVDENKQGCSLNLTTEEPKGHARVFLQKIELPSIDEVGDVRMRRMNKESYKESQFHTEKRDYLVFRTTNDIYENIAFSYQNNKLSIIVLEVPTNENLDTQMQLMLHSYEDLK